MDRRMYCPQHAAAAKARLERGETELSKADRRSKRKRALARAEASEKRRFGELRMRSSKGSQNGSAAASAGAASSSSSSSSASSSSAAAAAAAAAPASSASAASSDARKEFTTVYDSEEEAEIESEPKTVAAPKPLGTHKPTQSLTNSVLQKAVAQDSRRAAATSTRPNSKLSDERKLGTPLLSCFDGCCGVSLFSSAFLFLFSQRRIRCRIANCAWILASLSPNICRQLWLMTSRVCDTCPRPRMPIQN